MQRSSNYAGNVRKYFIFNRWIQFGSTECGECADSSFQSKDFFFSSSRSKIFFFRKTMLPVILGHTPAGAATQQLVHYGQEYESGHFRRYDHGWFQNYIEYKRFTPPDYNLQNVRAKVAIYYSVADALAVVADVQRLADELPNVVSNTLGL